MARRTFPDNLLAVAAPSAATALAATNGMAVRVYTDSAATKLADITTLADAAITNSQLTIDTTSSIPLFKGPNDNRWILYVRAVAGGPIATIYARNDETLATPGDARSVVDAAMTNAAATLTSATAAFTSADIGKTVVVQGAGAAGVPLKTTISAVGSATSATLAAVASATVSSKEAAFGTDATTALAAAIVAAAGSRSVELEPGVYLVTDTILTADTVMAYALAGARTDRGANGEAARPGFAATKILFRPVDQSKRLVRAYSTTASLHAYFGPFSHANLTFDFGDANGFQFGLEDLTGDGVSDVPLDGLGQRYVVGVHFEHCALVATHVDRASNGSGQITRSGRIVVHLAKAFESTFDNVSLHGGDTQIRTWGCDKPTLRNVRSLGAHLPFDFHGSGTFGVQHVLTNVQVEGWTFTPLRSDTLDVSTNIFRFEQNDGSPAGSGRYALPDAVVVADYGIVEFPSDMTNILFPGLSILELSSSPNITYALVTALSGGGTLASIDTTSTVFDWTDATATAVRIHGYGPLSTAGSASHSEPSCGASLDCPSFVYVVGTGILSVSGGFGVLGAHGDIRSLIIGNHFVGQSQMQSLATFDGCFPIICPPSGHPFARVTNQRSGYGYGNGDLANNRVVSSDLAEDISAVRRVWAFTPAGSATATNNSARDNPIVQVAGDANTEQAIWAWHCRPGFLVLRDETLPSTATSFIRLRFRARALTGTATVTWYFSGNSTGGGQAPTVGTTWTTFEYVLAMPAQWQGTNTLARAVIFDDTGYYLAGCTVEELTTADRGFFPAGAVTASAALATNATDGFLYIPTCAGTPTGTPTARTGTVPVVFDTTNNKFYVYDGSWLGGTAPGVFS